jgi:hypothetical protein
LRVPFLLLSSALHCAPLPSTTPAIGVLTAVSPLPREAALPCDRCPTVDRAAAPLPSPFALPVPALAAGYCGRRRHAPCVPPERKRCRFLPPSLPSFLLSLSLSLLLRLSHSSAYPPASFHPRLHPPSPRSRAFALSDPSLRFSASSLS